MIAGLGAGIMQILVNSGAFGCRLKYTLSGPQVVARIIVSSVAYESSFIISY